MRRSIYIMEKLWQNEKQGHQTRQRSGHSYKGKITVKSYSTIVAPLSMPVETLSGEKINPASVRSELGFCYMADVPDGMESDAEGVSGLTLMENGKPLPFPRSLHADIRAKGSGGYSHWKNAVYFSSSDNTDPRENGRIYSWTDSGGRPIPLENIRYGSGHRYEASVLPNIQSDSEGVNRSSLALFEDGNLLGPAHAPHWMIDKQGEGLYSHWGPRLQFSASDNTDPTTNGRKYAYRRMKTSDMWKPHPRWKYFVERGGLENPPPSYCNIGLTEFCNLRCTICGSQMHYDRVGAQRRAMDIGVFRKVAETLFPLLAEVEINSRGEPLVYPHIEEVLDTIRRYGCNLKLQSNATLLTSSVVDLLSAQRGFLNFSIDATGELFNQVRRGGDWKKVDEGLRALLKKRDPDKTIVQLYPTMTRRTLPDMLNLVKWAADAGMDAVYFHRYDPIYLSTEEEPSSEEIGARRDEITRWAEGQPNCPIIEIVGVGRLAGTDRYPFYPRRPVVPPWPNYPKSADDYFGHPLYTCAAPVQYVDIGLDGEIYVCCQNQEQNVDAVTSIRNHMGYATSAEEFADAWFGEKYRKVRESLIRGALPPRILPNCDNCVRRFLGSS